MNDPHVVSLTYGLVPSEEVSYDGPPALVFDRLGFSGKLEDGVLIVTMKDHYPTTEGARSPVERFLRAWEVHSELSGGRMQIGFEFKNAELVDRNPPPPGASRVVSLEAGALALSSFSASLLITRKQYPAPPDHFQYTAEVKDLWDRYQGYLKGREPLPAMGYFCLTVIERLSGGRPNAAHVFGVQKRVLDKLGELTSERGDALTARKASRVSPPTPLTEKEAAWIVAAVKGIIRSIGEAGTQGAKKLELSDLPTT